MHENPVTHLAKALADRISAKAPVKAFDKLPEGLADLCISHCELLLSFENIRQNTTTTEHINILDVMAEKLKENIDILLNLMGSLTGRDIKLHRTAEGDTLWKLAKSYGAELNEICELNNPGSVLKPFDKRFLLIPSHPVNNVFKY